MAELRIQEVEHTYVWESHSFRNPIIRLPDHKMFYPLFEMDLEVWQKSTEHFKKSMMIAWIAFWKDKETEVSKKGRHLSGND